MSKLIRAEAESTRTKHNLMKNGTNQVTLKEIYEHIFPNATSETINQYMDEELAAEIDACYAFTPVIELIRLAHSKNIKIIIVSDTYLNKAYLTRLLASKLPPNVLSMITEIFCSCDHHYSKTNGLFKSVLTKMNIAPHSILHIGDNPTADFTSARKWGMHALHLLHQDNRTDEILRMQTIAASLFDNSIRVSRSAASPFRGLFASQLSTITAESLIGYVSAGPILYAFSRFIHDELNRIKATGKNPKVLFLMRDGYLPSLVCETIEGKPIGKPVRISRFTSFAASFRNQQDIESYLANNIQSQRYDDLARQLLLSDKMSAMILKRVAGKNNASQEFTKFILQADTVTAIVKESTAYRKRLIRYLENEVDLKANDYLFLVDLGYTGTTQNKLAPIFKDEMNVDMFGCYLISLCTHENAKFHSSRSGLFDTTRYDDNALVMLVTFIAVFEQICTTNDASVIDFDEQGNPIFSNVTIDEDQQSQLTLIQSECVRFARDAHDFCLKDGIKNSIDILRDTAGASLCRFIFFLTQIERECLQTFKFELNLGTKDLLELINVDSGLTGLRRRGWLHSLKDSSKSKRMNYPAELRAINYSLILSILAEHRFGLKIALSDLSQQRETIEIVIADGNEYSKMSFDAMPTYDGFFSMLIPVVNTQCEIGMCFGQKYHWIEFESAQLINFDHLYTNTEIENTEDASPYLTVKHLIDHGSDVYQCESAEGMLIFVPNTTKTKFANATYILRVVFRPVGVRR